MDLQYAVPPRCCHLSHRANEAFNDGKNVQILRAESGKASDKAAWVPSPTIADGKLLLRLKDRIRCFILTDRSAGATCNPGSLRAGTQLFSSLLSIFRVCIGQRRRAMTDMPTPNRIPVRLNMMLGRIEL